MALKTAIAGATGRMGLALVAGAIATPGIELVAVSERPGYDEKRVRQALAKAGAETVLITNDPEQLAQSAEAVIDFTTPDATLAQAEAVARSKGILIIGTTGFTPAQQESIERYAQQARIVQSGNFSLGVNLLEALVEKAARTLKDTYDIEIFEMHHKHKKDAPSGTALMLGRAAAKGRGKPLETITAPLRDGITEERLPGQIGFSAARGGDVVGIHHVMFAGPGEMIELRHQGFSRDIYAHGALQAVLWAAKQPSGLYSMWDVLAL